MQQDLTGRTGCLVRFVAAIYLAISVSAAAPLDGATSDALADYEHQLALTPERINEILGRLTAGLNASEAKAYRDANVRVVSARPHKRACNHPASMAATEWTAGASIIYLCESTIAAVIYYAQALAITGWHARIRAGEFEGSTPSTELLSAFYAASHVIAHAQEINGKDSFKLCRPWFAAALVSFNVDVTACDNLPPAEEAILAWLEQMLPKIHEIAPSVTIFPTAREQINHYARANTTSLVALLLAHEIAHIVHIPRTSGSLADSLATEEQADKFALRLLRTQGDEYVEGLMAGHMMSMLVMYTISRHPHVGRRMMPAHLATRLRAGMCLTIPTLLVDGAANSRESRPHGKPSGRTFAPISPADMQSLFGRGLGKEIETMCSK